MACLPTPSSWRFRVKKQKELTIKIEKTKLMLLRHKFLTNHLKINRRNSYSLYIALFMVATLTVKKNDKQQFLGQAVRIQNILFPRKTRLLFSSRRLQLARCRSGDFKCRPSPGRGWERWIYSRYSLFNTCTLSTPADAAAVLFLASEFSRAHTEDSPKHAVTRILTEPKRRHTNLPLLSNRKCVLDWKSITVLFKLRVHARGLLC